jgi:hypothetical protein
MLWPIELWPLGVVRRRRGVAARPNGGSRVSVRAGVRSAGRRRTTGTADCVLLSPDHRLSNSGATGRCPTRRAPPGRLAQAGREEPLPIRMGESALRGASSCRSACVIADRSISTDPVNRLPRAVRDGVPRARARHARLAPDVTGEALAARAWMQERGHSETGRVWRCRAETRKSRRRCAARRDAGRLRGDPPPTRERRAVGPWTSGRDSQGAEST